MIVATVTPSNEHKAVFTGSSYAELAYNILKSRGIVVRALLKYCFAPGYRVGVFEHASEVRGLCEDSTYLGLAEKLILKAFVWSGTDEGFDFWEDFCERISSMEGGNGN